MAVTACQRVRGPAWGCRILSDGSQRKVESVTRQGVSDMHSVTTSLFAKWKNVKGLTSDRAACSALGLSHGATVYWRQGRNASADVIARMARDLGHDDRAIASMILEASAESSTGNAEAARVLRRLAERVAVIGMVIAMFAGPAIAYAGTCASACKERTLYIMSRLRLRSGTRLAAA